MPAAPRIHLRARTIPVSLHRLHLRRRLDPNVWHGSTRPALPVDRSASAWQAEPVVKVVEVRLSVNLFDPFAEDLERAEQSRVGRLDRRPPRAANGRRALQGPYPAIFPRCIGERTPPSKSYTVRPSCLAADPRERATCFGWPKSYQSYPVFGSVPTASPTTSARTVSISGSSLSETPISSSLASRSV